MEIEVLLFGPQATLAGARSVRITVNEATPAAVLEAIAAQLPKLAPSIATSRLAVNHTFAAAEARVAPGDEVALIGMVSGG